MDAIPPFEKSISFLQEIKIGVVYRTINDDDSFLPGFLIEKGKLVMDVDKIKFHGDILHEAAHIAVVPSAERSLLDGFNIGQRKDAAAEEMMAIAWTYAACIYLQIDPNFVFHENGYKGGGSSIVDNFRNGQYIGVPVLQWLGMTTTSPEIDDRFRYPAMIKWLRD